MYHVVNTRKRSLNNTTNKDGDSRTKMWKYCSNTNRRKESMNSEYEDRKRHAKSTLGSDEIAGKRKSLGANETRRKHMKKERKQLAERGRKWHVTGKQAIKRPWKHCTAVPTLFTFITFLISGFVLFYLLCRLLHLFICLPSRFSLAFSSSFVFDSLFFVVFCSSLSQFI